MTLEPCHRSRPGTAPSLRRRSPFASDAAAGHDGQRRCTISLRARTIAFSAPGIACEAADASWRGPESISENFVLVRCCSSDVFAQHTKDHRSCAPHGALG